VVFARQLKLERVLKTDAEGKKPSGWLMAWLPATVMVLAIAWQYRAGLVGRVYWFEDISAYFEPHWTAAARQMRAGYLGSWDLGAWSGFPLVGDPQIGVLYPLQWLWLLVHPLKLYAWLALVHPLIGAAGMYRLARLRGRSAAAAAVAGLTLGLGAFMVLEVRHAMFLATTAWLPWVLVAVETVASVAAGDEKRKVVLAAVAGGGAALALAILGGGWSMLLYAGWVIGLYAVTVENRRRPLWGLAGIGVVGVGLAAAQILPALSHLSLSPRGIGVEYGFASSFAWPSWSYLATVVLPTAFGDEARGTYSGASNQWELCGYGVGLIASLLALASLGERRGRTQRLAMFGLLVVAAELARGADGFLHPLLFKIMPVAIRCPARALYVWVLAAPILAADGLDAVVERLPRKSLPAILVVLVAAELLFTWRSDNPSMAFHDTRTRPTVATQLRGNPGRATNDVHLAHRLHNSGLAWGTESAGGYSSLPIWRYLHFLWIANHGAPYPHAHLADDLTAQGLWRFDSPLVDLLSITWLIAPADRPPSGTGWVKVSSGGDGIDLWRNDEALPRVFVVHQQRVVSDEDGQARAIASATFAPSREVVVDHAVDGVAQVADAVPGRRATGVYALDRESALSLAIGVQLRVPGVMVTSEPWSPWWRVTVDGKPAEALRVDYALRGVAVPAGVHTVAWTYEDDPLFYGVSITVTTTLALLVAGIAWGRRGRRRRT